MRMRFSIVIAASVALMSSAASASEAGCPTCFREVVEPPVYKVTSRKVMVQRRRHVSRTIPAQYTSVPQSVLLSPARQVWQVTHDIHGNAVGCWVTLPPQYGVQHRHVRVSTRQAVRETIPAVYATQQRAVLVRPGRHHGWAPIGTGYVPRVHTGIGVGTGMGLDAF